MSFRERSCPLPARLGASRPLLGWRDKVINYKIAIFRQINKEKAMAHHVRWIAGRRDRASNLSVRRSASNGSSVTGRAKGRHRSPKYARHRQRRLNVCAKIQGDGHCARVAIWGGIVSQLGRGRHRADSHDGPTSVFPDAG